MSHEPDRPTADELLERAIRRGGDYTETTDPATGETILSAGPLGIQVRGKTKADAWRVFLDEHRAHPHVQAIHRRRSPR